MSNSHDEDVQPTILEVDLFPTTPTEQTDEDFDRIAQLLADHEFSVADVSLEQGGNPVLTNAFLSTPENLDQINDIQQTLAAWYPDYEVTYSQTYSDFYRETALFPEVQVVSVTSSGDSSRDQ
ncbi:RidA family protein [Haloparvum sedimenti]|uniref:RidA family protein n=1 Tax=Haloparvum sedimenti TaxID=1678448 RepID=UPI000F7B0AE0|nr:RidA family protein [Haloparvum sedimenti]